MTKRDFELIATVLAQCESEILEIPDSSGGHDRETSYATLQFVVTKLTARLAETHPRFNRAKFETWSLPVKHAKLRDDILRKLGKQS